MISKKYKKFWKWFNNWLIVLCEDERWAHLTGYDKWFDDLPDMLKEGAFREFFRIANIDIHIQKRFIDEDNNDVNWVHWEAVVWERVPVDVLNPFHAFKNVDYFKAMEKALNKAAEIYNKA